MWKAQKGVSRGETGLVRFMENVDDAGKIVLREKKSHTRQARFEVVTTETEEKCMLTVSAENEKCLLKTMWHAEKGGNGLRGRSSLLSLFSQ